jgi:LuxR family maltose regulon positive regulatory protein
VTEALLKTKLYIPPLRPNLVSRPRLIERLNQGLQVGHKLTLISAPAGFGKTTLVSEWLAKSERPAAWLSLDAGDADPARFLAYFITAMQTIESDVGAEALAMLQSPQPPAVESILTTLLNELAVVSENLVLILDDYHVIDAQTVDEALAFLLERLPPQVHLVIATREDPNLPLALLRARSQLIELRANDLRFTADEAAEFLNQVMHLGLSRDDMAALESRTEGWIVGLQMAALALQGRADSASFIQTFSGSHHFVLDFLVGEVLQGQPEQVRNFLLQTSILDRLSGPLGDAVRFGVAERPNLSKGAGAPVSKDGKEILQALERSNLFVIPLDDERRWYRYHHLFADVLRARLMEEQPDKVPELHLRASEWYEQNGSPADAIHHALVAEDDERAAALIELAWPAMDGSFQSTIWLGWAKKLPDPLVRNRPVLSTSYAWALLNDGELESGEARLRDAERWLDAAEDTSERLEGPNTQMVIVDEEQFHTLPASIASARVYYAQALGDMSGSIRYAQQALDLLPEDDYFERGRLAVFIGLAYWASGDLEDAYRSFADAMTCFQTAGNILYAISFTFILADIRLTQGRLREAISTYERSLKLVTEQDESMPEGIGDIYLGLSELAREQGNLEAARRYLLRSEEVGEQADVYHYHRCIAQARKHEAQGDLVEALELLDEAKRWLDYRTPLPDVRPIAAMKTRVWIRQDRLAEARNWAREQGLSVDDELSYLHESEHITLAKILIAQYQKEGQEGSIHEAMGLLKRLLKAAEEGARMKSVIEILVAQALAYQALDDTPSALTSMERALTLAEPEDFVRIFLEEGPPMATLLREAAKQGLTPNYVSRLQAAFEKADGETSLTQPLIDPLSSRELEVLELLVTDLSGPEIAAKLMVSPNTMRTHTKNIYSKLDVHSRRAAVRKAKELDLLK